MSRCKIENIDNRNNINSSSLFYLTNSIKNEIIHISNEYKNKFKNYTKPNIYDVVYYLTKYELIKATGDFGGYYDKNNKVIAYNPNNNKDCTDRSILHEIGHFIQHRSNNFLNYNNLTLSHFLYFERQAETISYYLYNLMFKYRDRNKFNSYFLDWHIKYLHDYYNCLEYDLKESIFFVKVLDKTKLNAYI